MTRGSGLLLRFGLVSPSVELGVVKGLSSFTRALVVLFEWRLLLLPLAPSFATGGGFVLCRADADVLTLLTLVLSRKLIEMGAGAGIAARDDVVASKGVNMARVFSIHGSTLPAAGKDWRPFRRFLVADSNCVYAVS